MAEKDRIFKVLKFVLTVAIVVPNFVANTLVCFVVKKDKSYHTFVNFLLVHLAVTDFLVGIFFFVEVYIEAFVADKSTINTVACKLFSDNNLIILGAFTSSLIIIMISVYKYLGIVKPLRSIKYGDVHHLKFIIPLTWIASVVVVFPRFELAFSRPGCVEIDSRNPVGGINFLGNVLGFFFGFLIPVGTLGILVWKISRVLRKRWKPLMMNSTGKDPILKTRRKAIRRLGYVILVFFFSVLPFHIVYLLRGVLNVEESTWGGLAEALAECIFIAGSSINPFLYWISNQKFRRSALKLCGKAIQVEPLEMRQRNSRKNDNQASNRAERTTTTTTNRISNIVESQV